MPNYYVAYLRKKKIKGKNYYYIVEGRYEKGKPKQRVVKYVGNITTLIKKLDFWENHHEE